MRDTTTVIIGAGHCGLAMSRCLAARSVGHVVLERAEVANSWRTQRWDSLRLLTPNWMTRLPGYAYRGPDPDGYLSAGQVTAMLADYAAVSAAPVLTGVTVTSVTLAAWGVFRSKWWWERAASAIRCSDTVTMPGGERRGRRADRGRAIAGLAADLGGARGARPARVRLGPDPGPDRPEARPRALAAGPPLGQ